MKQLNHTENLAIEAAASEGPWEFYDNSNVGQRQESEGYDESLEVCAIYEDGFGEHPNGVYIAHTKDPDQGYRAYVEYAQELEEQIKTINDICDAYAERYEPSGWGPLLKPAGKVALCVHDDTNLQAENDRIRRMAFSGTADNFLKLSDEDKKMVFAAGIRESTLRKRAEEENATLKARVGELEDMLRDRLDLIRCGIGSNYSGDPYENELYTSVAELLKYSTTN